MGTVASNPSEPTFATTHFADISLNNAASTIVPLGAGQTVATNVTSLSGIPSTHVRIVVLGYFESGTGSDYSPINPCAGFDTRSGVDGFLGKRVAGTSTTYQISGAPSTAQGGVAGGCGVPSGATAVLVNLVAILPESVGNFRAYATGTTPTGGVVNFRNLTPSMNNSNAIVVPLPALGELTLDTHAPSNNGIPTTHARGVILGYYD